MKTRVPPLRAAFVLLAVLPAMGGPTSADPGDYFRVTVVDDTTGRGIPLVELRAVSEVRYDTDSAGIAAIGDPEMMGRKVYFRVSSPGYEYPADGFGYRGVALSVVPGGTAVIKLKRLNIAERLYRVTGSGLYRDSVLTGQPVPVRQPVLNGQVVGQDTVEVTPYRGKLYWFFGDTNRPSYPLGQFATSGATSLPPGRGGLDPSVGVDLTYWVGGDGFSRPMIPLPDPPGPIWVGGLFTMTDGGRPRLFTRFTEIAHDQSIAAAGLAEFNDDKAVFEPVCAYPKDDPLQPEGHPFPVDNGGRKYLYFQPTVMGAFPLVRSVPDRAHLTNGATFESFTCLAPGARYRGADTRLDRAPDGRLVWAWKRDTPALGENQADALVAAGKLRQDELLTVLHDVDTDKVVLSHGGSVFWNPYRRTWVMITTQAGGSPSYLGEVWFAEADTPVGPWLYAKRVATHGGYTYYNPTQHPFFDADGGRRIYFEGTYTDTYSGVKDLTPRYNYNQLMYRLDLADPRLSLPAPVYRLTPPDGPATFGTRTGIEVSHRWASVQGVPFYAVPPGRAADRLVPVYAAGGGAALTTTPPAPGTAALFFARPAAPPPSETPAPDVVPLFEFTDPAGRRWYAPDAHGLPPGVARGASPLCRVWRNPSSVLALDAGARPAAPPERPVTTPPRTSMNRGRDTAHGDRGPDWKGMLMARSFGEPLTRLRAVPIEDNDEPLVDPRTLSKRIHFALKHPKFAEMPRTPRVRRSVAEQLAQAAESLPEGVDLQIIEGFRPLAQQRFMYEKIKADFARKHPEWSKATLHRITNTMSAPPDDPCPPPHSTGGAVDLCLIRVSTGEQLDTVSPFDWDETSAPTRMKGLTPDAQANRDLLIRTLEATGLTNYTGEWWHWSYGDSGWALRVGAGHAVYDRLPESVT